MEAGATCGRCGAATTESRWCPACGLDLRPGEPRLPTPEAIDASRREADWLARQQGVTQEPAAAQDPAAPAWDPATQPWHVHPNPAHVVRWIASQKEVDQRVQGLGIALVVAGFLAMAVAVYFSLIRPLLVEPVNGFEAPGGVTERLDGGEERIIFIQTDGTRHGHVDPRDYTGEGLGCTVRETSGGAARRPRPAGAYTLTKNRDVYEAKRLRRAHARRRARNQPARDGA